jgi:hypothetical protein
MAGFALNKWIRPSLEGTVARLAALGLGPTALLVASLVIGLTALPSVATGRFRLGLTLILLSRAVAAIGGTNAGAREARLGAAFELIFVASIPFAFALNDPTCALAASLLLFGLIVAGAASQFANVDHPFAASDVALCVAAYAISCLRPQWFALIAYILAVFCFIAAGARIALAFSRSDA